MSGGQTPSQTVGPFFAFGLVPGQYGYPLSDVAGPVVAGEDVAGERIRIEGRVLDGEGAIVDDALIEIWQADGEGRYGPRAGDRPGTWFRGFGRCGTGTDEHGRFWFDTVKPGVAVQGTAPFVSLIVFMRGMLLHAYTRLYFSDEAAANAQDPVLSSVPSDRRGTLIAQRETGPGTPVYRFDIHMQGDQETVFFDA